MRHSAHGTRQSQTVVILSENAQDFARPSEGPCVCLLQTLPRVSLTPPWDVFRSISGTGSPENPRKEFVPKTKDKKLKTTAAPSTNIPAVVARIRPPTPASTRLPGACPDSPAALRVCGVLAAFRPARN